MFERWTDFFLMSGSAAAVLVGLIFVVMTLMHDRSRESVLAGSRLYMGPIVLNVSFILVLSAAALTPGIDRLAFAAIAIGVALWGLVRGLVSVAGIRRLGVNVEIHWTDVWYYGLIPSALYLALGLAGVAIWRDWRLANFVLAAVITVSLLLAIRNEWDLITWISPRPDPPKPD